MHEKNYLKKYISEPVDPNEERKKRVDRIKQMRIKKMGGRPTDAERERANQLVKIKCRICLRIYKSKSSYEDDQSKHAQYFELVSRNYFLKKKWVFFIEIVRIF